MSKKAFFVSLYIQTHLSPFIIFVFIHSCRIHSNRSNCYYCSITIDRYGISKGPIPNATNNRLTLLKPYFVCIIIYIHSCTSYVFSVFSKGFHIPITICSNCQCITTLVDRYGISTFAIRFHTSNILTYLNPF